MKKPWILIMLLLLANLTMFAQDKEAILTNNGVVEMVKAGLSEGIILAKIRQTKSEFDTSVKGLAKLKESGVSDTITIAMIEAANAVLKPSNDLVLDNELGRIEDMVAKKRIFLESSDEKAMQEIRSILAKNGFSLVAEIVDADLLIRLTSTKVARTMGTGGLIMMTNTVKVEMGKLSVYLMNNGKGKLIFQKEKKNTFPAKHLYTQAKSFTEDFVEELKKAERKKLKK